MALDTAAARTREALAAKNGQEEEFSLEDVGGQDDRAIVVWKGKKLKITYNREAISYKEWKRLQRMVRLAQADPENVDSDWIISSLALMLTGWNLTVKKGSRQPLPITVETLEGLPPNFLLEILNVIHGEIVPEALPETPSGSFS